MGGSAPSVSRPGCAGSGGPGVLCLPGPEQQVGPVAQPWPLGPASTEPCNFGNAEKPECGIPYGDEIRTRNFPLSVFPPRELDFVAADTAGCPAARRCRLVGPALPAGCAAWAPWAW